MAHTENTYVRARIDPATKALASDALAAMGLSVSDAIRLLMVKIADEKCLPFEIKIPSESTRAAMRELKEGGGKLFSTVDEFMADLDTED